MVCHVIDQLEKAKLHSIYRNTFSLDSTLFIIGLLQSRLSLQEAKANT